MSAATTSESVPTTQGGVLGHQARPMRATQLLVIAAAVGLLAGLSGCPGPRRGDLVWEEDFEASCGGVPCGWVQSGGPEGAVRSRETLPGEHGIELVGDGVSVRGPAGERLPRSTSAEEVAVRMTARCDAGGVLEVRVTIETVDGVRVTFAEELVPDPEWAMPLPDQVLTPIEGPSGPWNISRVASVGVRKRGDGTCEIAFLAIRAIMSTSF
jgi:hypothetical protein